MEIMKEINKCNKLGGAVVGLKHANNIQWVIVEIYNWFDLEFWLLIIKWLQLSRCQHDRRWKSTIIQLIET